MSKSGGADGPTGLAHALCLVRIPRCRSGFEKSFLGVFFLACNAHDGLQLASTGLLLLAALSFSQALLSALSFCWGLLRLLSALGFKLRLSSHLVAPEANE